MDNTQTTHGESGLNMKAMDTLNNRLAQVTSILDVLFLAGHPESELLHNPQLLIDALWPARELLEQATEAAGQLRLCERLEAAA